jgi:hypothetical protein
MLKPDEIQYYNYSHIAIQKKVVLHKSENQWLGELITVIEFKRRDYVSFQKTEKFKDGQIVKEENVYYFSTCMC